MITAITLTGDRPLALALCKRWMVNQVVKPGQWIVVDDGRTPSHPIGEYVRREPNDDDPKYTMLINMKLALARVKGDRVLFFEDDEYYHPDYIKEMSARLDKYELVGIGESKYYHLPSGGYNAHKNMNHASLAQTGIHVSLIPFINKLCNNPKVFLDTSLWEHFYSRSHEIRDGSCILANGSGLIFSDSGFPLYVGIKGLPGRGGIGIGHKISTYNRFDTSRSILKQWIPVDNEIYLKIIERIT